MKKRKMEFVNRERELESLEKEYRRKGSSFVVIYGRRRTGKTTLIEKFIEGKPYIYFLADLQAEALQIGRFRDVVAESLRDELLKEMQIQDWETLFKYIVRKLPRKKLIIAIDEFQYLAKVNKSIPSIFQRIWDSVLKDRDVMLILCGSLIGFMYDTVLSYSSPLYGRRTAQIKLQPMDFFSYREFFDKRTNDDIFRFYCITGGIPKYVESLDLEKDLFTNIKENILNKNSFLYAEPKFVLKEEIKDPVTYFSLLQVISQGEHKIGKIASKLGMETRSLTSFIDRLIELEIIERRVPVTESNPAKSKKGLYFIKDNFFNFWFRYVFPYQSYLETENYDYVVKKIKADFDLYASKIFEDICIDFLKKRKVVEAERIGRWWNKEGEIDVMAIGEKEILYGECKYQSSEVGPEVLKDLKKKAKKVVLDREGKKEIFALFSRKGFTKELREIAKKEGNVLLFTVEDLI